MKRGYPLLTSTRIKAAVASAGLVFAFLFSGCSSTSIRTVSHPLAEGDFKVDLTICKPEEESEKSLLLLPPTGGTNSIDRSYAKRFCNEGFNVYLINDWSRTGETGDDLGFHQRAYTNSQHAISLVLDQVDTPYVGMIGTSVGATHASVAANVFDKINAVFFIVGGVPLMEVVATSDHPSMVKFHEKRFKNLGFKNDLEYTEALSRVFKLEPTLNPNKNKTVGVVIATKDETVPTKTQKQLIDYFHPTKVITIDSGHVWTVVKTWLFHTQELVDFFNEDAKRKLKP